jgi:peptidoglycan hydrolase-like protein with peptidoglycan-binding domain
MPMLNPILPQNAQGDQVKAVQANLTKIGLTVPPAETASGTYGTGTVDAVKQFQAQAKSPVTGLGLVPITLTISEQCRRRSGHR